MSDPMTPRTADVERRAAIADDRAWSSGYAAGRAAGVASWLASPEAEEALAEALWAFYHEAENGPFELASHESIEYIDTTARAILASLLGESDG